MNIFLFFIEVLCPSFSLTTLFYKTFARTINNTNMAFHREIQYLMMRTNQPPYTHVNILTSLLKWISDAVAVAAATAAVCLQEITIQITFPFSPFRRPDSTPYRSDGNYTRWYLYIYINIYRLCLIGNFSRKLNRCPGMSCHRWPADGSRYIITRI